MSSKHSWDWLGRLIISLLAATLLTGACLEVNRVAWGTGVWLGEYSPKWALGFFTFVLVSLVLFALILTTIWSPGKLRLVRDGLFCLRARMGIFRWVLALAFLFAPVYLFQYTYWGVVFTGAAIRMLVWALTVFGLAFTLGQNTSFIVWPNLLAASLLSGTVISAAIPLASVTNYPFSLAWSEGNRMWDYSFWSRPLPFLARPAVGPLS